MAVTNDKLFAWELEGLRHHLERAVRAGGPNAEAKVHAADVMRAIDELIERREGDVRDASEGAR